jgi:hypothetical protein
VEPRSRARAIEPPLEPLPVESLIPPPTRPARSSGARAAADRASTEAPPPPTRGASKSGKGSGSGKGTKPPAAGSIDEQVVADAVRLIKWGRAWHELAEAIARFADRPGVVEVRKILRTHKAEIERLSAD